MTSGSPVATFTTEAVSTGQDILAAASGVAQLRCPRARPGVGHEVAGVEIERSHCAGEHSAVSAPER